MSDKFGVPTDEQLTKINELAKRTLSKDEVFFFSGSSAGDMLIPGRYTKLSKELLQVMVDDARRGVSFMLNHNWGWTSNGQGIPYGKVFDGRLVESTKENQTMELYLDKYIVRDDDNIDGISNNALIKRIETGVLSDTSISFNTDVMKCSICGENYYSGKCRHWRGAKYEMGDGTQKTCYATAMPPSILLPYSNNALYEESIVWDGAYPGAAVTQSKHGDIIETPSGKFRILEDKEELPENTPLLGHYHNGNIITMVKKSDHKKIYSLGGIDDKKPPSNMDDFNSLNNNAKGAEKPMDENLKKMLDAFGIEYKEDEVKPNELLNQLAEKWDATVQSIKDSAEPLKPAEDEPTLSVGDVVFPKGYMEKTFGKELSADELEKFVKEGQEYRKNLSDEAIAMGVRAMGNDFPKETWENSFDSMSTADIKNIMKTWELQAKLDIPAGRKTNPDMSGNKMSSLPDDAFKVGK